MLSILTPAFNEQRNLPLLYERLREVLTGVGIEWEWIIVDDHSADGTFPVIQTLASQDHRVRGVRLSRNFGSHIALMCGMHFAQGECAMVLAADLQDPPETIPTMLAKWRQGAHVVWAVRAAREGERTSTVRMAGFYYWIMRHVVGMKEMPSTGADFFLLDRAVVSALRQFPERNVSVLALVTWMGFRQEYVTYRKEARLHGRSGWTLKKKLKLFVDSITSFSYMPIRAMSCCGVVSALLGFLYAVVVIVNGLLGRPMPGWSSIMVVVLIMGGIQMLMMGVLGEYVWRGLDEARRRPKYLVEATVNEPRDAT